LRLHSSEVENLKDFKSAPDEVSLDLAGIPITFQAAHPGFYLALDPDLAPFETHSAPEVILRMHNEPAPIPDLGPVLFDSKRNWTLRAWQGKTILHVRAVGLEPNHRYYVIVLDPDLAEGDIYYQGLPGDGRPQFLPVLEPPLDEILLVQLLAQKRGLLFHASGVSLNGHGLLFTGTSGSGKSTLSKQWREVQGVSRLSDEMIGLRLKDDCFWLYGTHRFSSAGVVPPAFTKLDAIFMLKHGLENKAIRLNPSRSASRLLLCSHPPIWDAEGMAFTLQLLDELVQRVPCYEFHFLPDSSSVEYLRWMLSI